MLSLLFKVTINEKIFCYSISAMRLLSNREVRGKTTHESHYKAYSNEVLYLLTINVLTDIENRLVVAKGVGEWGREGLGVWD